MSRIGKFLMSTALVMMALAVVRADSMETFMHTTPTQAVPFTDPFSLPEFNTSLGTLDSVTLTIDATGTADVRVLNIGPSSETFTDATATTPVTLTGPGPVSTSVSLSAGPISGTALPFFPSFFVNDFPGLAASASGFVDVPTADFGMYEGTGSMMVTVTVDASNGSYAGTGPSTLLFGGSASAGAVTTITYDFTPSTTPPPPPIPEPATMSMVGGAMFGLVSFLKRRQTVK